MTNFLVYSKFTMRIANGNTLGNTFGNALDNTIEIKGDHLTINASRQPEGYITDMAALETIQNGHRYPDITMRIDNLPKTATVTFDIEFIDMSGSSWPAFSIFTQSVDPSVPAIHHLPSYLFIDSESVDKQRVTQTGDSPILLKYKSRILGDKRECVRLKYSGNK